MKRAGPPPPVSKYLTAAVAGALVAGQVPLLGYLLRLHDGTVAWLALFGGVPAAVICFRWLTAQAAGWPGRMSAAMFAAGGFGMLLGAAVDAGPLGFYRLVALCRGSVDGWPGADDLWLHVQLMPRAYLGMLAGGALGAWAFDACRVGAAEPLSRQLRRYLACGGGMLAGMLAAEYAVLFFTLDVDLGVSAALTVLGMLSGMVLGMAAVALAWRLCVALYKGQGLVLRPW